MLTPIHIGPDIFLDLENRDFVSREQAVAAWDQAYAQLEAEVQRRRGVGTLNVVCGIQGSGKSTWIASRLATARPEEVFFDAALPSRKHRVRAVALAKAANCKVVAIWLEVPLSEALIRNARRQRASRIAESTVHHVFEQLQPPSTDEGFDHVVLVV